MVQPHSWVPQGACLHDPYHHSPFQVPGQSRLAPSITHCLLRLQRCGVFCFINSERCLAIARVNLRCGTVSVTVRHCHRYGGRIFRNAPG